MFGQPARNLGRDSAPKLSARAAATPFSQPWGKLAPRWWSGPRRRSPVFPSRAYHVRDRKQASEIAWPRCVCARSYSLERSRQLFSKRQKFIPLQPWYASQLRCSSERSLFTLTRKRAPRFLAYFASMPCNVMLLPKSLSSTALFTDYYVADFNASASIILRLGIKRA